MTGVTERFPKIQRLVTPAEFTSVFKSNKRSVDAYFLVLYRKNGLGYSRLGLAVSKRKIHRAVDRNRAKRVIRESFRKNQHRIGEYDLVVMPQQRFKTAEKKSIWESLNLHWERISR